MENRLKLIIKKLLRPLVKLIGEERLLYLIAVDFNRYIIELRNFGYLHDVGWIRSFQIKKSVDVDGMPIPWTTYPFLDFISCRLKPDMLIFEYGAGSSTVYYSNKVKELYALETSREWYDEVKARSLQNVQLSYEKLEDDESGYANFPNSIDAKFDIIIIDGLHREKCLQVCYDSLSPTGVIVLDDTNNHSYRQQLPFYTERGFKKLDFWGMSPFVLSKKCTSVLYRRDNCLNI